MNVFAKFDEIPSMILQDIKETKRYGHTDGRSFGRSDGRSDNVKTVYPPTNKVCGGYKKTIVWSSKQQALIYQFTIKISLVRKNLSLGFSTR